MTKKHFILKAISCLLIIAALFYYNQMIKLSSELVEANTKINQMADQGTSISDNKTPLSSGEGKYKDGTYSGTAQGYGGPVTTKITVKNGRISGIEITSSDGEDAAYYNMCLGILDKIVSEQSADVDTVSGATYTSNGIINGSKKALQQAAKS